MTRRGEHAHEARMFLKGSENIVQSSGDYHRAKRAKAEAAFRREQLEQAEMAWPKAQAKALQLGRHAEKLEDLFYALRRDFESQGLDFMSGPSAFEIFMEASGGNVDTDGPIKDWHDRYGWLYEEESSDLKTEEITHDE